MGREGLFLWVLVLFLTLGQSKAYVGVQWPLQIIFRNANSYIYGVDPLIIDAWTDALDGGGGSLYAASAEAEVCEWCNGTLSASLNATLGRYSYFASSVATAVAIYPKSLMSSDAYISSLYGATGLAPLVCSYSAGPVPDVRDPLLVENAECNILASTSVLQAPGLFSSITGSANDSNDGLGASTLAGQVEMAFVSPMTLTQLGTTGAAYRTRLPVNMSDAGVTVQDEDGLTGTSMLTYLLSDNRTISSPSCSEINASLLLGSVATQIVGGDALYCFDLNGVVLVTAWTGTGVWPGLTPTNCSDAILAGVATMTLVFPQNFDTTGQRPFAYALFSRGGSQQCAYGIFQTNNPSVNNANWALLYLLLDTFPSVDFSSCDVNETHAFTNAYGLDYTISACGLPGRSCEMNGTLTYVNNDNQPLEGSLQFAPNSGNTSLIGPAAPTELNTCLWLQVSPSPGVYGDGSVEAAKGIIPRSTALMYNSGKGLNHQAEISAAIAGIQGDIGSLTIFNSLSAGMSAVAAGVGINAFKAPSYVSQHQKLYRIFPVIVSIVEAAFINVATLTYVVALARKGTSTQVASWFDVDFNGGADYTTVDIFVATDLTLTGRANFYVLQWVVLCLAILLSASFVMYRWHKRPEEPSVKGVADLEGAPSSDYKVEMRPKYLPYSDALESKFSGGSLGSAGSQGLTDADSLRGLQLTTRR